MTAKGAQWLLAAVIAARATSFLFSTMLLATMGPFSLMGLRFLAAFAVLAALFAPRLLRAGRAELLGGLAAGLCFFGTMAFELNALTMAPSSTVSFLENLAIVLVPLATAVAALRLPAPRIMAASAAALAGVGLLTVGQGGLAAFGPGELLALGGAACYAAAIMVTARVTRHGDALVVGIVQVGVMGVLGAAATLAFEQPALPATEGQWLALAALVAVCTGFGFTLQPVAQQRLTADRAALFCAITPLTAGTLGIALLGEPCGPATLAGMALIVGAIVLASLPERPGHRAASRARADAEGVCAARSRTASATDGRPRPGLGRQLFHGGRRKFEMVAVHRPRKG